MRKYRRSKVLPTRSVHLRNRIARTRRRAKCVGLLYLIGIIALAAAACLPLISHDLAPIGVMTFWKTFTNIDIKSTEGLLKLVNSSLYALMLLGVVINVLRALGKLGWLFKKKASRTYGFNRNVYALEDLGNIFSGSFAVILSTYFLIAVICGDGAASFKDIFTALKSGNKDLLLVLAIPAAIGVLHLLFGFWGAKIAYYDVNNGEVDEERRVIGRIAPFIRNALQLVATCAIFCLVLQISTLDETIVQLTKKGGVKDLIKDMPALISAAAQLVMVLCTLVLIKHATATTEFNIDGTRGPGMKNFRVFSFFLLLAAGGLVAYNYFVVKSGLDKVMLILAGVAFVAFVIELIMRKLPKFPDDKLVKKEKKIKINEDEISFDDLPQFRPQAQVQKPEDQQKPLQSF